MKSKLILVNLNISAMAETKNISNQYKESKQYGLIMMILTKYGKEQDILDVIEEGKECGFIQKTGESSGKEKKPRGPSRWSAYQGECKRRAAAEGKPHLKRDRMKEIWNSEDYKQFHEEWDRVAKELNSGKSFRDIEMPMIPGLD